MLQPVAARVAAGVLAAAALAAQPPRSELVGFAALAPDTFAEGPASGRVEVRRLIPLNNARRRGVD
jgi:hypothetical protein